MSFRYTAIDSAGLERIGRVRAEDASGATLELASRGLAIASLEPVAVASRGSRGRVRRGEVSAFTREMSAMLKTGVPLDVCFSELAAGYEGSGLGFTLADIAARLRSGDSASSAIARHTRVFGRAYIDAFRAAERTGEITLIAENLATMLESEARTSAAIRRALSYPSVVLFVVMIALVIVVGFVIPRFASTLGSADELPLTTRVVMTLGASFSGYWYAYLLGLCGAAAGVAVAWRRPGSRSLIESRLVRLPIAGPILVAVGTARFARVLCVSLRAGLELVEAVTLAGGAPGTRPFAELGDRLATGLRRGLPLPALLADEPLLPGFARRMLGSGGDAAGIAASASVLAEHFEERTDGLTKSLGAMLEPVLTILLAGIVLLVALSVFQPMWQ
ncbi:MAG: type II secretion system F family protein, partial [Planctomycetota bacterium]